MCSPFLPSLLLSLPLSLLFKIYFISLPNLLLYLSLKTLADCSTPPPPKSFFSSSLSRNLLLLLSLLTFFFSSSLLSSSSTQLPLISKDNPHLLPHPSSGLSPLNPDPPLPLATGFFSFLQPPPLPPPFVTFFSLSKPLPLPTTDFFSLPPYHPYPPSASSLFPNATRTHYPYSLPASCFSNTLTPTHRRLLLFAPTIILLSFQQYFVLSSLTCCSHSPPAPFFPNSIPSCWSKPCVDPGC